MIQFGSVHGTAIDFGVAIEKHLPMPTKREADTKVFRPAFAKIKNNEIVSSWKDAYASSGFSSHISDFIEIIASQNLSISALLSLSVGSIIKVPATGNETVGA